LVEATGAVTGVKVVLLCPGGSVAIGLSGAAGVVDVVAGVVAAVVAAAAVVVAAASSAAAAGGGDGLNV
jgi:hypothetical protein